jgi:DNA-binding transcriptional LysR family regulator
MNIKQLEYFIYLSDSLNFSRTAQHFYVSQPAITHQMNTLEDELKVRLFIRTKRKVILTPAGTSFYNEIKDILTRIRIAITKAQNYNREFTSNISIGYGSNDEVKYMSEILKLYKHKSPHIYVHLQTAAYEEKTNLFVNNKLDILFTTKESIATCTNANYFELFTSKFVCIFPKEHPLSTHTVININELPCDSFVILNPLQSPREMTRVQNKIQENYPNAVIYLSDSPYTAYAMIKGGYGIAIMPDFASPTDSDLSIIPLAINESISFGICWHKNVVQPEIKTFVAITKEVYHATTKHV